MRLLFAASLIDTPGKIAFVALLCGAAIVAVGAMKDTGKAYWKHGPWAAGIALVIGAVLVLAIVKFLAVMDIGQQAIKDVNNVNSGQVGTKLKPGQ